MTAAKCVGAPPGRGHTVCRTSRIRSSRDAHLLIKPSHCAGQSDGFEQLTPEGGVIGHTPQFWKPAPQVKPEYLSAFLQPTPPAPDGAMRRCWAVPRRRGSSVFEHRAQANLLQKPVVPTPWGNALRQARACAPTARTVVAGDRHRVCVRFATVTQIRLAVIMSVPPDYLHAAVRTRRRSVDLRCLVYRLAMLLKAGDAGYNSSHRLVSFLSRFVSITSHDSRGVPAYPSLPLSRLTLGSVSTIILTELGMLP